MASNQSVVVAQGAVLPTAAAPVAPTAAIINAPQGSSSLYVGELLPEVNEAILFEKFNTVGPVASIRVCRDAVTRRSLGYAYVNFQSPADAERALDTLNFESISGKPCRIMWCQRDPTVRRSGVGNVFVKGLEKSIDNKALYDAFSIFGNISSVKVVYDANGNSVGRGFVHFETAQAAEEAIDKANGTLLKDKKINVAPFKSRKERMEEFGSKEHQFKNVFIKNLGEEASETDLENLFKPFGAITSFILSRDPETHKGKGFGFVCFAEFEAAKKAVEELNGKEVNGKPIYVGRAMKKSERNNILRRAYEDRKKEQQQRSRGVNLYVKNLDDDFDDNKLRETFQEFGTITSTKIMRDEKGNSRGFGFVCFSTQEEATRAITEFNGRILTRKPLYVALAQPKDERRQHLNQQYRQRLQFQRQPNYMPQPNMYAPQQMLYLGGVPPQFQQRPPFFPGQRFPAPNRFPPQAPYGQQQFPRQQLPFPGPRPARPGMVPRAQTQGMRPPVNRPNTRYSTQARNIGAPPPQALPAQGATSAQQLASLLAQAEPERQKQLLGDHLYPIVVSLYPQAAGKLTGMLLQMDNSELLHLLEDHEALQVELQKAESVLAQHNVQ